MFSVKKMLMMVTIVAVLPSYVFAWFNTSINLPPDSLDTVDHDSYDGTGFDMPHEFIEFVDPQLYTIGSFSGMENVTFTLISNIAAYDGYHSNISDPLAGDEFGILDKDGNFINALGPGSKLGTTITIDQPEGDEWTFALRNPEGVFSSIKEDNQDDRNHMIAMEVVKDGTITLTGTLWGDKVTVDVLAGDIIVFIEDLWLSGNKLRVDGTLVGDTDFDFNDMIVLVRGTPSFPTTTEIPEPASMLLLGLGLAGVSLLKRRS